MTPRPLAEIPGRTTAWSTTAAPCPVPLPAVLVAVPASSVDQLAATVRNRLKRIQYRPALIDGFLAQTGLTLEPEPS
ncbi:MAG: hypothetical protein ACLPN6_15445 [Streptosporangiaceae bacterium]